MNQEIKNGKIIFYKQLILIPPELAVQCGIRTEAPVFIDPWAYFPYAQEKKDKKLLIYQGGLTVRTHNIDQVRGGIRYWQNNYLTGVARRWSVVLEPLGKTYPDEFFHAAPTYRSEAITVRKIVPLCVGRHNDDPNVEGHNDVREIHEGVIFEGEYGLWPICSLDRHKDPDSIDWRYRRSFNNGSISRIKYGFVVDEQGGISFYK
ncbi:MAG: hypothetical protein Q7R97_02270 [Candidatus Daviesbacteria bacterium]|nr:hypothetical protein [Candidatus Daviesbacteria bacterium]